TSCPAKIPGVEAETENLVQAKVVQDNLSDSHVVTIYVSPATGAAIDERINVELELFPPDGKSVVITKPVSVYRFQHFVTEGEEP
ncbi:MAG TPA: hypothetical protein DEB39_14670, partial [Planctomycetaceae bacterium]|nr:hypothetical protein [Planctomycetaceae bacterium]